MNDGVIKYNVKFKKSKPLVGKKSYKTLEKVRSRLLALKLIGINDEGIGYGNISVRDNDIFHISGTQTGHLKSLKKSEYSTVVRYSFDDFTLSAKGGSKPSSEAFSHAMIYDLSPKIKAAIHVHSFPLWEYMIKEEYKSTSAEYGTKRMTKEIKELFTCKDVLKNPIFVMKGHKEGVMVFGKNLEEAEKRLYEAIGEYLT